MYTSTCIIQHTIMYMHNVNRHMYMYMLTLLTFTWALVRLLESGVMVVLVLLVSVRESWCNDTRSSLSTFSADLMGVAHFLAERRLRADWPELGGVGVDCTELVLVEPALTTSVMAAICAK